MPTMNRQWVLKRRPVGEIEPGDLDFIETPLRPLADGEVLIRMIYLSLDPTNRIWMSDIDQYLPPVQIGDVMRGGGIGVIVESRSSRLQVGDIVNAGLGGWQDYAISPEAMVNPVPRMPGVPLTAYMSVLGMTGLTAYFGMTDIGAPKPGETVVISAAAGAVGSIAGQVAKLQGARVIGIAGSEAKCGWLSEHLGFDGVINYRTEDVGAALDRLCPNGVDVNFENVGGDIMNAVVARMNNFSRMPLCGLISGYNLDGLTAGPEDFGRVLMKRILIKGFIIIDYLHRAAEGFTALGGWVAQGKLIWKDHPVDGLENAAEAVKRLFSGDHDGKLMIRVSPEP